MKKTIFVTLFILLSTFIYADNAIYYAKHDKTPVLQTYDTEAAVLGYLAKGTPITVTKSTFASSGLYTVKINGVEGYVKIEDVTDLYLEQEDKTPVAISKNPTYYAVRDTRLLQTYNIEAATVARISKGETFQIVKSTFSCSGLYEAVYNGKQGYVLIQDVAYLNQKVTAEATTKSEPKEEEFEEVVEEQQDSIFAKVTKKDVAIIGLSLLVLLLVVLNIRLKKRALPF